MSTHQAKKQKLHETAITEEFCMDPIEKLVPELHQLVFQHFSGSDFIKCSTVSTKWNEVLTSSDQMMSKVNLLLNDKPETNFDRKVYRIFRHSKRCYKNSRVEFSWNQRNLWYTKKKILKHIAESLEDLVVRGPWEQKLNIPRDIVFPKLKSLKLVVLNGDDIRSCLGLTPSCLQELEIMCYDILFDKPLPAMTAKLTSLDLFVTCVDYTDLRKCQQNLKVFFGSVSSTLKYLSISFPVSYDNFELVLKDMKDLESLSILSEQLTHAYQFRNQTISTLELQQVGLHSFIGLRAFVNLQKLQLNTCDKKVLKKVLRRIKKDGVRIEMHTWWGTELPVDVYETLKESDPSIPRNVTFTHELTMRPYWLS
jgi:hypothetical protein